MSLNFVVPLLMGLLCIAVGLYGLFYLRKNPEKEMIGSHGVYYSRDYSVFMMLVVLAMGVLFLFFAYLLSAI